MKLTRNKYLNTKVNIDGTTFDSKKESKAYLRLKELADVGLINNLELHPKWELIPKITETYTKHLKTKDKECERVVQLPITYTADFSFNYKGKRFVLDVKPSKSLLPKEFVLKEKLMRYFHNIEITKIYALKDLEQFTKI